MPRFLLFACAFAFFCLVLDAGPASAQEQLVWSFEQSDRPAPAGAAVGQTEWKGEPRYNDRTPGKFIYDPLSGRSRPNAHSAEFQSQPDKPHYLQTAVDLGKLGLAEKSLTLEAFIKPALEVRNNDYFLAGKTRATQQASDLALVWRELRNSGQTWHGGRFAVPGERPVSFHAGHYSSATRLARDYDAWRHLALVYHAEAKRVVCWVDYHLSESQRVAAPLAWDDGPFLIGGAPESGGLTGLIDEVRITAAALAPQQFLRARNDAIAGVSFASQQKLAPRDAGCLDIKEHFGAAGDGKTDDTAAFNFAFQSLASKVPLAYSTLLIPPGEYLVSDLLYCSRFIDIVGAGPEKTIIRLRDGVFTNPEQPKPVLRLSSTRGDPGSHRGVNGSSISIYCSGLTIDTGKNNPGAKALEYHSNNLGRLENVVLKSGDGGGVLGLDLTHHDVGPALVKRVRVEGFETGAAIRYQEYSMTFEQFTLRGQKKVGLLNQGNIVALRKFASENACPALVCTGANSMAVLLDSSLTGGAADQPAIRAEGGLYALRVQTAGYRAAVEKRTLINQNPPEFRDSTVAGPNLDEYIGDKPVAGFGSPTGALKLPIEETPEPALPPLGSWVSLEQFTDKTVGDDWGPALQAAVDSGAKLIYVPRTLRTSFRTPVKLRSPLERIVGYGGAISWHPEVWKKAQYHQTDRAHAPPPLLIYDELSPRHVLVLDRLACSHVQHASRATLVLRSSSPECYSVAEAGGKLFAEDVGGADWRFEKPQQVWVRQWNPESHASGPCVYNRGCPLWVLGFKTEYESQKLLQEAGAQTEILGSFIYPLGKIPPERPIFESRDSDLSLVYGTSVYQANHKIHIRDSRGSETRAIGNDAPFWAGSRARMDLYTSRGK